MTYVVNQVDGDDLVAFVRTPDGTVTLYSGDAVPAEADEDHVALLVEQGVLSEKSEPKAPAAGKTKD